MPTILLADEAGLFVALETTPVMRAGCRLVSIRTARELLARAATVVPDILLLDADVLGPGLKQGLKRLKADRRLRSVPIVIAASNPDAYDEVLSDRDILLAKPVGPEKVAGALKKLLPLARRGGSRVKISVPVICSMGGRRFTVRTKDVGISGFFLKTPRDLAPGATFEATFSLPDPDGDSRPISATCEVVRRVDPEEDDLIAGIGATFVQIGKADAGFLKRFVSAGQA
jgi:hypothetical protein